MKQKQSSQLKRCSSLCCRGRPSSSSSECSGRSSDQFPPISSIAHAMVQERLDQMIRERFLQQRSLDQMARESERRVSRNHSRKNKGKDETTASSCIIMVAMDKYSYDPKQDFKHSMSEVITSNRINGPKELRCVLNCFLSMNSVDCRPIILEVFHEVCTELLLYRKCT